MRKPQRWTRLHDKALLGQNTGNMQYTSIKQSDDYTGKSVRYDCMKNICTKTVDYFEV